MLVRFRRLRVAGICCGDRGEAIDRLRDLFQVLVQRFDVGAARQIEDLEYTLHRVLDQRVDVGLPERDPIREFAGFVVGDLDGLADVALEVVDAVGGVVDPLAQRTVERVAAAVDHPRRQSHNEVYRGIHRTRPQGPLHLNSHNSILHQS